MESATLAPGLRAALNLTGIQPGVPVAEPPLRCAVLVPTGVEWTLQHVNCDMAHARAIAEAWAIEHPGRPAVIVTYQDHVTAAMRTEWAK